MILRAYECSSRKDCGEGYFCCLATLQAMCSGTACRDGWFCESVEDCPSAEGAPYTVCEKDESGRGICSTGERE